MAINGKRLFFVNTIAALAYLSCLIQWLLAVLPFASGLVRSDVFKTYVSDPSNQTIQPPSIDIGTPEIFSGVFVIIAIALAVGVLVFAVIMISRTPAAVGKTGAKLTHSAAEVVLPVITHHKKITPKKRGMLTARIVFNIKLALVVIPLLLVFVSPSDAFPAMSGDVLIFVAALCAGWSLCLFCLQTAIARILRVDLARIW